MMRNKFILLTGIFIILFMGARAQFTSGKYLLGGDLNFRTEKLKGYAVKNEYTYVNLKFGKVIKENTVVVESISSTVILIMITNQIKSRSQINMEQAFSIVNTKHYQKNFICLEKEL